MMMMVDMDEVDSPSRWVKLLYYLWKIFTCLFVHLLLIGIVVAYCFLGAIMFERLEQENEKKVKLNVTNIRRNVSEGIWMYTQNVGVLNQENWTAEVRKQLKAFEIDLVWHMRKGGWDGNETLTSLQWTHGGALFYSIIVITTIGYGHIAPKTPEGKIATIFYAVIGIPLMLLCLSNIGDVMAQSFRFLYWRICCYKCTRPPKRIPPPFQRRARSIRGRSHAPNGHGSIRHSVRSRTASARHSRNSQRSAEGDSAIGMSEGYTRSSYSDTECRYYDELERENAMQGAKGFNRQSQQSRYSDNVTMYQPGRQQQRRPVKDQACVELGGGGGMVSNSPVLYNRYALFKEDSVRLHPRSQTSGRRGRQRERERPMHGEYQPGRHVPPQELDEENSVVKYRRERPQQPSKMKDQMGPPRIMSPMGFAVSRQTFHQKPPARDYYYDDYYNYYGDYMYGGGGDADYNRPVPIWLCVFLVVSYIIGGAFLFDRQESNWGLSNSAYFCFITLTTIGFGDFVPEQKVGKDATLGTAICSLYLLFGIALLAMSFNLVQEEVINNVKAVARHLGIIKDEDGDN